MNRLAKYHPQVFLSQVLDDKNHPFESRLFNFIHNSQNDQLPMAVMEHSKSIGGLINDLENNEKKNNDNDNNAKQTDEKSENKSTEELSQEDRQNLAAYYYYLSLASLANMTSTVASSVYKALPSKESISSIKDSVAAMIRYDYIYLYFLCNYLSEF